MIRFSNVNELENILNSLSEEDYQNKKLAIENNFNLVEKYAIPEDWLFENNLKNIL